MEKLRIGVVSIDSQRSAQVAEAIARQEEFLEEVIRLPSVIESLETDAAIYIFKVYDEQKLKAYKFDQLVLDFALIGNKNVINEMLSQSRIETELQIVDDRSLLV